MGFPVALALSLAASVAGAGISARQQRKVQKKQNELNRIAMERQRRQTQAERARQREFEALQAEEVTKALEEASPETIAERTEEIAFDPGNIIVQAADDYNVPTLVGQVANKDVDASIGQTIGSAVKRTREMLRSAALLQGNVDAMSMSDEALQRMASEVRSLAGLRQASAQLGQREASVGPGTATPSSNPLGDLLMIGGSLGAYNAGSSIGAAGGAKPFDLGSIFRSA